MTITLATLKDATAQQVFDQVARHLVKQGKRSMKEGSTSTCAYRGTGGTMCAAGCLIADDEYLTIFDPSEGMGWIEIVKEGYAPNTHQNLIQTLQNAHDSNHVIEQVLENMHRIAINYDLSPAALFEIVE